MIRLFSFIIVICSDRIRQYWRDGEKSVFALSLSAIINRFTHLKRNWFFFSLSSTKMNEKDEILLNILEAVPWGPDVFARGNKSEDEEIRSQLADRSSPERRWRPAQVWLDEDFRVARAPQPRNRKRLEGSPSSVGRQPPMETDLRETCKRNETSLFFLVEKKEFDRSDILSGSASGCCVGRRRDASSAGSFLFKISSISWLANGVSPESADDFTSMSRSSSSSSVGFGITIDSRWGSSSRGTAVRNVSALSAAGCSQSVIKSSLLNISTK